MTDPIAPHPAPTGRDRENALLRNFSRQVFIRNAMAGSDLSDIRFESLLDRIEITP